jgi:WD40 repeat protein
MDSEGIANNIQLPFATSHAFIIGINDYQHVSRLTTAVSDATIIAAQLKQAHGYHVHGPLLNASKSEMMQWLQDEIPNQVGVEDRILFYFAGHGIALDGDEGPNGYLVAADTEPGVKDSLISMNELHDALTGLPCRHGLLILDCCFSGAFKWSSGFRDVVFDMPKIIYEERFWRYCKDPAWQVITSSAYDQKAVDIIVNQSLGLREASDTIHSPFAGALLKALQGEADIIPAGNGDGVITATELYTYLRDLVEAETTENVKRQSPSLFNLQRHDKGEYIFLNPRHRFNLPPTPDRNPFMGLASFSEGDATLFYGRDRVVEALLEKVNSERLIVVSGASGTGKSSVIKAGILPALRKQGMIILPVIRPGKEPMQSIANEIIDVETQLNAGPSILVIDQYEELITQCLNPEDRDAFEQQLVTWLDQHKELKIILSIRSDFEPQFESETLATYWQRGRYVVPSFSLEEIREVIAKPAVQAVLFYEPDDLIDQLSEEVSQAPGALPLLSFTLSELYHAYLKSGREDRALTEADYHKLGGVVGALRNRANAIYNELAVAHQYSMRNLMIRMVSVEGGELASRRVHTDDLIFSNENESKRVKDVAQKLVHARLVSTGRDAQGNTYYEPAHDALVRAWARLWEWIKAMGEGKLGLMYKLSLAVTDYQLNINNKKAKNYLWHDDPRLDLLYADILNNDHGFNAQEEAFVKESYQLRNRNNRRKWAIVAAVIIGLAGLAVYAFIQQRVAQEQALIANNKTEEALIATKAAQDSARVAQNQREFAILKSQEALDSAQVAISQREIAKNQTLEANNQTKIARAQTRSAEAMTIATAARNLPRIENILSLRMMKFGYAKTKPLEPPPSVSRTLASKFYSQSGHQNNPNRPLYASTFSPGNNLSSIEVSPNNQFILTASHSEHIPKLWNRKGELLVEFKGHAEGLNAAIFDPSGEFILTNSKDNTAILWDTKGKVIAQYEFEDHHLYSANFSPKGKYVITYFHNNTTILWNIEGNKIATFITPEISFSLNENFFLTNSRGSGGRVGGSEGPLESTLWDTEGNQITTFEGQIFVFSSAGDAVFVANDETLTMWEVSDLTSTELGRFSSEIINLYIPPCERAVLVELEEQIHICNLVTDSITKVNARNVRVVFSPNCEHFVTWFNSATTGEFTLWTMKGDSIATIKGKDPIFSPDGRYILALNSDLFTAPPEGVFPELWDLKGQLSAQYINFFGYANMVTSGQFSPDGKMVITASMDGEITVWNTQGELIVNINNDKQYYDFIFSPSGEKILASHSFRPPTLYSSISGDSIFDFEYLDRSRRFEAARFSPDGSKISSVDRGREYVLLWTPYEKKPVEIDLTIDSEILESVNLSHDGNLILTTSSDARARLYNTLTNSWQLDFQIAENQEEWLEVEYSVPQKPKSNHANFSKNGMYILAYNDHKSITEIRHLNGDLMVTLKGYGLFSPDSKAILTTAKFDPSYFGNITIDDKQIPTQLFNFEGRVIQQFEGYCPQFSKNGKTILTLSRNGVVKLWNVATGKEITLFNVRASYYEFSPDDNRILILGNDGLLKLWDIYGKVIADFSEEVFRSATFSPNGQWILTHSQDWEVKLWPSPERIYQYLNEESPIPDLTEEEKEKYGIR